MEGIFLRIEETAETIAIDNVFDSQITRMVWQSIIP